MDFGILKMIMILVWSVQIAITWDNPRVVMIKGRGFSQHRRVYVVNCCGREINKQTCFPSNNANKRTPPTSEETDHTVSSSKLISLKLTTPKHRSRSKTATLTTNPKNLDATLESENTARSQLSNEYWIQDSPVFSPHTFIAVSQTRPTTKNVENLTSSSFLTSQSLSAQQLVKTVVENTTFEPNPTVDSSTDSHKITNTIVSTVSTPESITIISSILNNDISMTNINPALSKSTLQSTQNSVENSSLSTATHIISSTSIFSSELTVSTTSKIKYITTTTPIISTASVFSNLSAHSATSKGVDQYTTIIKPIVSTTSVVSSESIISTTSILLNTLTTLTTISSSTTTDTDTLMTDIDSALSKSSLSVTTPILSTASTVSPQLTISTTSILLITSTTSSTISSSTTTKPTTTTKTPPRCECEKSCSCSLQQYPVAMAAVGVINSTSIAGVWSITCGLPLSSINGTSSSYNSSISRGVPVCCTKCMEYVEVGKDEQKYCYVHLTNARILQSFNDTTLQYDKTKQTEDCSTLKAETYTGVITNVSSCNPNWRHPGGDYVFTPTCSVINSWVDCPVSLDVGNQVNTNCLKPSSNDNKKCGSENVNAPGRVYCPAPTNNPCTNSGPAISPGLRHDAIVAVKPIATPVTQTVVLGGRAYYFSPTNVKLTWFEALTDCRNKGMELVAIETADEHTLIVNYVNQNYQSFNLGFFTSGSKINNRIFYWNLLIEKPLSYINWGPNQPNDGCYEECLAIANSKSDDYPCTAILNWICEQQP